ncbi:hypothetical protein GAMM_230012 [Gammaproteobacteria bacterium]
MERPEYIYFLINKDGLPLYQSDAGQILIGDGDLKKPNGQPANLRYSPQGWKDTLVKFFRNVKYFGMFRDMTVPMTFPKDGGAILKDQIWKHGIEAVVYLLIKKLNRIALGYLYEDWYLSELNFSKYKEQLTGVVIEATEGGVSKYLKAFESTLMEVPIDTDAEVKTVLMDGVAFDFNRTYGVVGEQACVGTLLYYLGMVEFSREGNPAEEYFFDVMPKQSSIYPNEDYAYRTDKLQDIRVHTDDFKIFYDKAVNPVLRLEVNDGISGSSTQYDLIPFSAPTGTIGETRNFTFDVTITVPAGSRVHFKLFGGSGADPTTQFTVKSGSILIDYVYKYASSYVNGLYIHRLIDQVINKMSDGKCGFKSDWLLARKDLIYTCGDSLRGIKFDDTVVPIIPSSAFKISIYDLYKSLRYAGLGIEGNDIVIEPLNYFFRNNEISVDLGQVSDATIIIAEDLLFNTIKAGYEKQDYTDVNGKYEVNQGQQWSCPVTKIIAELNLISPVRADFMGAELLRINFEKKKTTDTNSDNDTFMLNTDIVEFIDGFIHYYKLYRPAYTGVLGLPHYDTAFNLELTPKHAILAHAPFIHGMMDFLDAEKIGKMTADKNKDLSTTLAGVTILQSEDIAIGALTEKLIVPYYFNFKTKVPVNMLQLFKDKPYGKVKFKWNDLQWYGYLWDGGVKTATLEVQEWKLIALPGQLLEKFNKL